MRREEPAAYKSYKGKRKLVAHRANLPPKAIMFQIALATGAFAKGDGAPGRVLNKQGSQQIDLSTTIPRRDSEDGAEWIQEKVTIMDSPDAYDTVESGRTDRVVSPEGASFATHATSTKKKAGQAPAHAVAVDLRPAPAVKKLKAGGQGHQQLELSWDMSLIVKATKSEAAKTGKPTKQILTNVAGSVKSGQMLAVMGSSGAGKSTFLDCVSLRNQQFTGNVFINNKPADESYYFMTGK